MLTHRQQRGDLLELELQRVLLLNRLLVRGKLVIRSISEHVQKIARSTARVLVHRLECVAHAKERVLHHLLLRARQQRAQPMAQEVHHAALEARLERRVVLLDGRVARASHDLRQQLVAHARCRGGGQHLGGGRLEHLGRHGDEQLLAGGEDALVTRK